MLVFHQCNDFFLLFSCKPGFCRSGMSCNVWPCTQDGNIPCKEFVAQTGQPRHRAWLMLLLLLLLLPIKSQFSVPATATEAAAAATATAAAQAQAQAQTQSGPTSHAHAQARWRIYSFSILDGMHFLAGHRLELSSMSSEPSIFCKQLTSP